MHNRIGQSDGLPEPPGKNRISGFFKTTTPAPFSSSARSTLQQQLKVLEDKIKEVLWQAAQQKREGDDRIDDVLSEMDAIANEAEVTQSARESETVEETIQNDAHHAKLRIQLVLETGMLPEVRAIVEPLFVERRALKRRIKKLAGFDPRNN